MGQICITKPFGKIDFYISEPFSVKDLELEDAKSLIKTKDVTTLFNIN